MSAAKCETGWGDLSTRALLDVERLSPHPAARFTRVDPPPPGEGGGYIGRYARTSAGTLTPSLIWPTDLMMSSPSSWAKQA